MKTHTHSTTTYTHTLADGTEIELELPHDPSPIMDYKGVLSIETDTTITIGYLADDTDCGNPLTDCDGMGAIYECRRHGSTLRDYEKALGLADGGPDLDLVDEDEVVKRAHGLIDQDPELFARARSHCFNHWVPRDEETDEEFIERCLDSINELEPLVDVHNIQTALWNAGRAAGTIGDPHAVLLDVYEHGGISYSVAGGGMQCQFDTARGGAVWVPDDCAREELLCRGAVYRKGDVNELRDGTFEVKTLRTDLQYDDNQWPNFKHWYEAFHYLEALDAPEMRDQRAAEMIAARELAAQACSVYTDWRNGNCYGVVVATYSREGGEPIDEHACYGFIGDDDAYSALQHDYFPKGA